jgi:hypothetical protein
VWRYVACFGDHRYITNKIEEDAILGFEVENTLIPPYVVRYNVYKSPCQYFDAKFFEVIVVWG